MKRVLLYYPVTSKTADAFAKNQQIQDTLFCLQEDVDKLIVSDTKINLDGYINLVLDSWTLAKANNQALAIADSCRYDYLMFLDSDCIITEKLGYPEEDSDIIGNAEAYYTKPGETLCKETKSKLPKMGANWFMVGRKHFNLRYCEDFKGLYHTDLDYIWNVLSPKCVLVLNMTMNYGIHVYHARRSSSAEDSAQAKLFVKRSIAVRGEALTYKMWPELFQA